MAEYSGGCHCGNISVTFTTDKAPESFNPRACQCSFCRKHSTRALSDPDGHVHVQVKDADQMSKYQMGVKATDFLVCRNCGVYVSAYMPDGDRDYANVMASVLKDHKLFSGDIAIIEYGGEDEAGKRERRRRGWTPASMTVEGT